MELKSIIPLYKPQNTIGAEVLDGIREVLESGWLTMGPKTLMFERTFADYIGSKHGVATGCCTSALYLSLNGLGIKSGSIVVVPVNTFVATANVVRWLGAEVLFCDVGADGEIDPACLARILEQNGGIDCIVPVHLYGFACDIEKIIGLVKKYGVGMVEDCAQSVGAMVGDKKVGSFGDAGCFSFYATKNMTTGEGGMLVTNNKEIEQNALLIRNHGQNKTPKEKYAHWQYDVSNLGFNFRMSDIEAAIGLKQMEKIDLLIDERKKVAVRYKEELKEIDGLKMLHDPEDCKGNKCVFHLLEITVEKSYPLTRDKLFYFLKKRGITTGVHYPPLHLFSYYRKSTNYRNGDFPEAEKLYSSSLSLPMFPFMTDDELSRIMSALKEGAHC
jgi:dTDP-4-amino-4,6-dideoxygalactose transaminase